MKENQFSNNSQFETQPLGNGSYSVSGVERISGKRKGKKAAIIGGVTAAVIIGGGVAAYNCSDYIKNQFKLRTMQPENYYAWVYENSAEDISKTYRSYYDKFLDNYNNGLSASMELKYSMSEKAKEDLRDSWLWDDEDDKDIEKFINDTESFSITSDIKLKGGLSSSDFGIKYNDSVLASVESAYDDNSDDIFARFPELTDKWLCINEDLDDYSYYNSRGLGLLKDILMNPASFASGDEFEDEVKVYSSIWCDMTEDVTIERNEEVAIADITVEYNAAEVSLDEKLALEIRCKMLEQLKTDDIIKNIVVNKFESIDADEYDEFIDEEIEDIQSDLADGSFGDDTYELTTYIDPNGYVKGFSVKENDAVEVFAAIGKDGDCLRAEVSNTEDDYKLVLTADETSKDTYDGSIEKYEDGEVDTVLNFESFELVNKEFGYVNGTVTFSSDYDDEIKLIFSTDGNSGNIHYDINTDGENYGSIELNYSIEKSADVDMPDNSDAFEVTDDAELKDYVSADEMKNFLNSIIDKLGIDNQEFRDDINEFVDDEYNDDYKFIIDDDVDIDFDDDDFDFDFDDDDFDFEIDDDDIKIDFDNDNVKFELNDENFNFEIDDDDFDFKIDNGGLNINWNKTESDV